MLCVSGIHLEFAFRVPYLIGMAIICVDAMWKYPSFNAFLLISGQLVKFGVSPEGSFVLLFEMTPRTGGNGTNSLFLFCVFVSCSFFRLRGCIHSFRSFLESLTPKLHYKSHPGLILLPNGIAQQRRSLHHPTPTVPSVQRELLLLFPWQRDQQEGNSPEMGFSFPHSGE